MSKSFNKVNSNIDLRLLSIKTEEEQNESNQTNDNLFNTGYFEIAGKRNIKIEQL